MRSSMRLLSLGATAAFIFAACSSGGGAATSAPSTAPSESAAASESASASASASGAASVDWTACVERLRSLGTTRYVELGPNKVLEGLIRRIDTRAVVAMASTPDEVRALAAAVRP